MSAPLDPGPAGPGPTGPAGPGPSGPAGPNGPQPSGPPHSPKHADDLMALAYAVFETTRFAPGEEPAPGSAAVTDNTVGVSIEPISGGLGAGVDVPVRFARDDGRVVGEGGAATFSLPNTRVPLVFPPEGPFPGSPPGPPQAGSDNPGPSMPPGVPKPPQPSPVPSPPPPLGVGPVYDPLIGRSS